MEEMSNSDAQQNELRCVECGSKVFDQGEGFDSVWCAPCNLRFKRNDLENDKS